MKLPILDIRLAFFLAGTVLLALCSAGQVDAASKSGKDNAKKEGSDHQKIIATFGIYGDPELQAYVSRIGQEVASNSNKPDQNYHFTVLNDDLINAFAAREGYIYITRGLLAQLNSEAELATVLGHEIAHVTENHLDKSQNSGKFFEFLGAVAEVITQIPGLYELSNLYGGVLLRGYSRGHELEADRLGIEYTARTGYQPDAMLGVIDMFKDRDRLEILQAHKEKREPQVYHGFLSTHPDNEARSRQTIDLMNNMHESFEQKNDPDDFLQKLNGLTIGKTQKVGIVRSNTFYYPKLRVKMTFPKGWHFQTMGRGGVQMLSPTREALLNFSTGRISRNLSPGEYLVKKKGLKIREGRELTIGGFPGFIGIADKGGSDFGPRPLRVAILYDKSRRRAYIFEGAGKHDLRKISNDKDFIATIFSFEKMSQRDFQIARVPRLQVVRAEPGTTMEGLAEASPITNYAEDKLRVINGMYPHGQPKTGQLIKIVD